jgi:hypothetical protein
MFGNQPDPAFLEYYEKLMAGKLDGFDRLLKKQKYLAGDVRHFFYFLGQRIDGICRKYLLLTSSACRTAI